MNDIKFMKTSDVVKYLNISKTTLYSLIKFKNFPKPKKFSKHNRWLLAEIDEWLLSIH